MTFVMMMEFTVRSVREVVVVIFVTDFASVKSLFAYIKD